MISSVYEINILTNSIFARTIQVRSFFFIPQEKTAVKPLFSKIHFSPGELSDSLFFSRFLADTQKAKN